MGDLVADPEIPAATVLLTALYVRLLQPPARGEQSAQVQRGETLFAEIGCAHCHVPMMRTGKNSIPELSEFDAHLYSDLLLHDMGRHSPIDLHDVKDLHDKKDLYYHTSNHVRV